MMRPFVVILSGPPAVGKNTVAEHLCRSYPLKMAEIDLDRIKFLVHNAPSNDHFLDLASRVGQAMLPVYLDAGVSVVIHKAFCSYRFVNPFVNICEDRGIAYWYFKLAAPLDELLRRNPDRCYVSPEDDLKRIYAFDQECDHLQGIRIDTVKHGLQGTVDMVLSHLNGGPNHPC